LAVTFGGAMSVKTHIQIVHILNYAAIFFFIAIFVAYFVLRQRIVLGIFIMLFGMSMALQALSWAFRHFVPAWCDVPGCRGRARPKWTAGDRRKDNDKTRYLKYICDTCGMIYYTCLSQSPESYDGW
jgi:hypothetical protein